ncbi:MAG: 6-phosphogluconolactonase [Acidobacteria bacterium]|nr:MAG: 6-phosphogluconolactonase [Acidobacteriota bacterium]
MPRVLIVPAETFAARAAECLVHALRTLAAEGPVSMALAGGATPRAVYASLAAADLPWDRLRVYFGDERAVGPDHPDSNYRMVRDALLSRVPIPDVQVFRMQAEDADLEAAAAAYAAVLPGRLDLLVLGVGADGHTASLFPGSTAAQERRRTVVPAFAPDPPRERLTITRPVIWTARHTLVLVAGAGKAAAVRAALQGPEDLNGCPAQLARRGLWVLDANAASRLSKSE